MSPSQVTVIRQ